MAFKRLDELTASELRTELKRAGIQGKYIKAQAIMRLTAHLIDISEDPLTFEFDPEMPIQDDATDGGEYEVDDGNDATGAVSTAEQTVGSTAASVSGLINSIVNDATSSSSIPVSSSSAPFVTTTTTASITSSVSITSSTVTTSSASAGSVPLTSSTVFQQMP